MNCRTFSNCQGAVPVATILTHMSCLSTEELRNPSDADQEESIRFVIDCTVVMVKKQNLNFIYHLPGII
jgi:hypothetical protein